MFEENTVVLLSLGLFSADTVGHINVSADPAIARMRPTRSFTQHNVETQRGEGADDANHDGELGPAA